MFPSALTRIVTNNSVQEDLEQHLEVRWAKEVDHNWIRIGVAYGSSVLGFY